MRILLIFLLRYCAVYSTTNLQLFSNVQVKLLIRVGRGESCRSKESPKINMESLPKEPSMSNIFTNVYNNLLPKRIVIIISEIIEVNQLFGV